jgi:hypothetical protein
VLKGDALGGFTALSTTGVGGSHPYNLAVGDVNVDGHLDVVATNFDNGTAAMMLGDGTGHFSSTTDPPVAGVADGPLGVALGDLNGDGYLDIVTANFAAGNVSVLLGDGTGQFTQALGSPITAGSGPISVAIGDVNNDHKMDIVVANLNSSNVSVLLGDGAGRFTQPGGSPVSTGASTGPFSVALGDVNNNGNLDIVSANSLTNNVTVLFGNGNGTFVTPGTTFAVGTTPMSVALGDVDGGGNLDIVVADSSSDNVSVLIGNGSGGFAAAANTTTGAGTHPSAVALGAITTGGKLAIVTANAKSNNVTALIR